MGTKMRNVTVTVVMVIALATAAGAKGPTIKLSISGPGVREPLIVTDAAALVHVWSNGFIGSITTPPDSSLPRYHVSFHVQPPRSDVVRVMYVVQYVLDPKTNDGFVYLPGRGEDGYRLNVGTMLREGHDGRWHRAPAEWNQAISARLRGH